MRQIKGLETVIGHRWADDILSLQCVSVCGTPVGVIAPVGAAILVIGLLDRVGGSMRRSEWLLLMSWWAWLWFHQISAIVYKSHALAGSSSLDAAPVTGSLIFYAPVCRLAVCCAAGFSVFRLFFRRVSVDCAMATDSDATAGGRPGITFEVTLDIPWNAPEAVVHLHSDGVVDLDMVPDVLGLTSTRPEAAVGYASGG